MLHSLKHVKMPKFLGASNLHNYSIPWTPGLGVDLNNETHSDYLHQLCDKVYADVKRLIDAAVMNKSKIKSSLHTEVLHHALLCLDKCASYCDRRDQVIDKVRQYVTHSASRPLIVHGRSGSGKTSIMANVAKSIHGNWCSEAFVVVRFLGTSPLSSSLRNVLVSVCEQICTIYNIIPPMFEKMDTIDVTQYFRNKLLVSLDSSRKLVIILDSIDQLSPIDGAYSMKWLPLVLPPSVGIIVSMLDEQYDCLANLKSIYPYSEQFYVKVGAMHIKTGLEIMDLWLSKIGRTITKSQRSVISEVFIACPHPLFLRLVYGHASGWKSYTESQSLVVPKSTHKALLQFYETLEEQFGTVLVQKALGYFTASKSGLTEAELEDVLSLDDEVLDDVYQYWDPPMKRTVRIPSLVWKRIRYYIQDYIVEQQSDGMTVLAWYHRQFNESAAVRYLSHDHTSTCLHRVLSEYFEGVWGNSKGKSVTLTHRNLFLEDANRQVPSQPLKFSNSVYNFRKLSQLPFHLLNSGRVDSLKEIVLCNYTWMHTKLHAAGYAALIQDYMMALKTLEDLETDVSLLSETLSLSGNNLKDDPASLAGQLLGRLSLFETSVSIHKLLDDARKWIKASNHCIIEPVNNCLISPGGELKTTILGHPRVVLGVANLQSLHFLVSWSKDHNGSLLQVWDVSSLECIENVYTLKLDIDFTHQHKFAIAHNEYLVAINAQSYSLWNLKTGDRVEHVEDLDRKFTSMAASKTSNNIFIGSDCGRVVWKSILSVPEEYVVCFDEEIKFMTITPDDKFTIVVFGNKQIAIVDNIRRQSIKTVSLATHHSSYSIIHSAIDKDDQCWLVVGTTEGTIYLSSLPDLSIKSIGNHNKVVKCITHISSLNLIVTGSLDKILHVWKIDSHSGCSHFKALKGHVDGIWCVDSIPDSSYVVSGSKDDYLKVWDVLSGDCLHTLEGHSSWISCVAALSPNVVVSGSNDKTLKFWNLDSSTKIGSERHSAQPECIALSERNTSAISGGPDALKVWNPLNGACLHSSTVSTSSLAFSSDGAHIISGSRNGVIKIYDTTSNFSLIKSIEAHRDKVTMLLSLSNRLGSVMFSSSLDSTIKIWDGNYVQQSVLSGHSSGITCMTYCNTSQLLVASGSHDCDICLWRPPSLDCVATLKGHCKVVNCLEFNSTGSLLVSGSDDTSAQVWDVCHMTCVYTVAFTDSVKTVCFTDMDVFIAGAHCSQNQLKVCEVKKHRCLTDLVGHTHAVMCMLKLDEKHILSGSRDGTLRVWNLIKAKMLCSFDLQSQVKHISASKLPDKDYLVAATTKSGPIAFLKVIIRNSS